MKKILTLLFAVVTVAAFALPVVQTNQKKVINPQLKMNEVSKVDVKAQNGVVYDASTIRTRALTDDIDTLYMAPEGAFFLGYFPYTVGESSSNFYYMDYGLIPGGVDLTWRNATSGTPSSYYWYWYDPAIDDYAESEEVDFTYNQRNEAASAWYAPILWAMTPETGDEPYYRMSTGFQYGGKMEIDLFDDGSYYTNMMPFSPTAPYGALLTPYPSATGTDTTSNGVQSWLQRVGDVDGADFCEPVAHVSIVKYPGRPYAFSRMTLHAAATARAGQQVTGMVCPVVDGLADLDNPIVTETYEFTDNVNDEDVILDFYFEEFDPDLGLTEEKWLVIDQDIALVFTGTNELAQFWPYANGVDYDYYDVHGNVLLPDVDNAYNIWNFYQQGKVIESAVYHASNYRFYAYAYKPDTNNQEYLYACANSFCVGLNAQFAFIENDDDAAINKTINANVAGDEVDLVLRASESYDAWIPSDFPEWVTIEATDSTELSSDGSEYFSNKVGLNIVVDALPAGVEGRKADITFELPGATYTLTVKQGEVAEPFYLVGTFNEWSQQTGMLEFVDNEGVLETEAELEAGAEFKVITPNGDGWTWYGGQDDNGVGYFLINDGLMNTPITLIDGANFRLEKAGKYTFQLDPTAMTLTVVPEAAPVVPGDVNGDGEVTAADVTMIYNILLNDDWTGVVNADQNGDGEVTATDVTCVYNVLLGE